MLEKGISPEEIITIGDDNNDAQMIKCRLWNCNENASQQVKK